MSPQLTETLTRFKKRYPEMDLAMVQFFSGAMATIHDIASLMESNFAKLGLSKGRFMVMIHLHGDDNADGVNISDVLSRYKVSSATMTGIIDTLEKEGLIERIRCPEDRRRVNVRITDAGREFMDDFLPRHHAYMEVFTSRLDDGERQTLVRLLKELHRGMAEGVESEIEAPAWRSK